MRRYTHASLVSPAPEALYAAIADVSRWPQWDPELESVEPQGPVAPGSTFVLRPKGGPKVKLTVETAQPGREFSDVAHLPLARMRTRHAFSPEGSQTRVDVTIELWGPLAFLWDRVIARPQAAGLAKQTEAFSRFAESVQTVA